MVRFWDGNIAFSDILLEEKSYIEKYDISYKILTDAKPSRIRLDKIVAFTKILDKISYLVLFDYIYCDKTCDKITYLISAKKQHYR